MDCAAYISIPEELISTITQLKRQALTREDGVRDEPRPAKGSAAVPIMTPSPHCPINARYSARRRFVTSDWVELNLRQLAVNLMDSSCDSAQILVPFLRS